MKIVAIGVEKLLKDFFQEYKEFQQEKRCRFKVEYFHPNAITVQLALDEVIPYTPAIQNEGCTIS